MAPIASKWSSFGIKVGCTSSMVDNDGSGLVMVVSSWKGSLRSGSCSSVSVVTTSASKLGVFVFSSVLWCVVVISAGESPWNMSSSLLALS